MVNGDDLRQHSLRRSMKTKHALAGIALLIVLAGATVCVWRLHGYPKTGIDDANIFFSYAANLASGHGITYAHNGESVEGFTSMLWMLACAFVFVLGVNETGVFFLCFVLFALTQFLLLKAIEKIYLLDHRSPVIAQATYLVLVIASPAYITWMTITLMDTCLWGVIVAGMSVAIVCPPRSMRSMLAAALPFLLAPLARPEALFVVPAFLVLLWFRCRSTGHRSATLFCLALALLFVVVSLALTAFRVLYFGCPFPNTFYAKVSPSLAYNLREGKDYLYRFVTSGSLIGVGCFLVFCQAASWLGGLFDELRRVLREKVLMPNLSASAAVSLGAVTLLVVPVVTGGDHFAMFRFFQPACPLIYLAVSLFAGTLWVRLGSDALLSASWWKSNALKGGGVGVVAVYWLCAFSLAYSWSTMRWGATLGQEFQIAEEGMAVGRRINQLFAGFDRQPAAGVITAGGIARTYDGPVIDLMGLNNSFIAHFKGERKGTKNHAAFECDAFFQVEPDILVAFPPVPPATNNCYTVWLKGLMNDPRFTARWCYGVLARVGEHPSAFQAFYAKSFVNSVTRDKNMEYRDSMVWSNRWVKAQSAPVDGAPEQ